MVSFTSRSPTNSNTDCFVYCRRTAVGLQRGAGHLRNSLRRARGLPPSAPVPEEPGPPTRPYGPRGGARRYPGRPGHHPGDPSQPQGSPGQPGQPHPVPSVSAHTSDGPGHSDIHPAYLPVCHTLIFGFCLQFMSWHHVKRYK